MKKRGSSRVFNIIMAVLIAVIVFCGIMAVGAVKGWFGDEDDGTGIRAGEVTGIASIERDGVGYSLKEDTDLRAGDILKTRAGALVKLEAPGTDVSVNEETVLSAGDGMDLHMEKGEIFVCAEDPDEGFSAGREGFTATFEKDTAAAVTLRTGSSRVDVLKGAAEVRTDGGTFTAKAGESLLLAGEGEAEKSDLERKSLDDFVLTEASSCSMADDLCFTAEEMDSTVKDRAEKKQEAEKAAEEKAEAGAAVIEGNGGDKAAEAGSKSCTISIECRSVLGHMDRLKPGKDRYVPENGVILGGSRVEFADGETVFDVLKRVCAGTGIGLEYSYTPMYGSYYIEGINNLYEFDCGRQSGWTYSVNGWSPDYGASGYRLKDGDSIVWSYTCGR